MVIWSGKGILSVLVLMACFFSLALIIPKEYSDYAFAISFFVAAAFSWFMGKKWNEVEGRIVIDKVTGEEILLKPSHSLFFIKMQYWGIIFGVFGLIILVQTLIKS